MMEVIKNLDHPQPQVLIKVVFLEVTHNDSLDIGIEGPYNGQSSAFGRIANYLTNYSIFTNTTSERRFNLQHITKDRHFAGAIDQAKRTAISWDNTFGLANQGGTRTGRNLFDSGRGFHGHVAPLLRRRAKAQLLSRPSVLARNNQPATIQIGQNVPLITAVNYDTFGNARNSIS